MDAEPPQLTRTESTRLGLVRAARDLFAERGYGAVSIDQILVSAGVSRGALYYHFRDKRDLFKSVFEDVDRELVEQVASATLACDGTWERLQVGSDAFLDACREGAAQRIVFRDAPSVLGWSEWRAIDGAYALGLIRVIVGDAMAEGLIEPQPLEPLVQVLLGALNEAAMVIANADGADEARAEVGRSVRYVLEGLRTR